MQPLLFPFRARRPAPRGAAIWRPLAATLSMAVLAGCTSLQTSYQRADVAVPAAWSAGVDRTAVMSAGTEPAQRPALADAWWTRFGDARLEQLVALALEHNSDLVLAAWNIRQAELGVGLAQDRRTPTVSANASTSGSRPLDGGSTSQSHGLNLGLSYELDLWGRLASQQDAAQWRLVATEQDLQTTAITLVANVAALYWQLAYQNEQIASGQESLAYVRRTQQLVQSQYDAGSVSSLELQEARRSIASQEAALVQLRQNRVATLNALAVLLNQPPSTASAQRLLPSEPQALPPTALPDVPAGIPAEVLARRPDVQAAEARLRATLADGDATRASYYPTIGLTGSLGASSSSLGQLLSNPVGSLGASLALPFLRQTEMRLSLASSRATYEAAVVGFQTTLLTALQEVEDALGTRTQLQEQQRWFQEQLDAAQRLEELNEVRYRAGSGTLKNWIDAQESRRGAELALSANRLNLLSNQLTLYKALGGDAVLPGPQVPTVQELTQR